jgi:ABC-2 type transport system permease protein
MRKREYLALWRKYIEFNLKHWIEYRMDFILGSLSSFASNMLSVIFFWVIFQNIPEINGWNFGQLLFLTGFLNLSTGIWNLLFEGLSPWNIERYILNGDFDRVLLKPVNSFFNMLISDFDMDALGSIISGVIILLAASQMLSISWSLTNILLFVTMVSSSVLILTSVFVTLSTISFWYVRSREFSNMIMHFMRFVEFPLEIYNNVIIFVLTFILPLGFISYYPSEVLLGKNFLPVISYLTPLISIVYFIASYKFWQFGLRHYTSTGS